MANIASAIGVALTPTQGSWRPLVSISIEFPATSILLPGVVILEVGFKAMLTLIS